jgi:uncharacterized membrane protein YhaH (DUF805 family)
MSMVFCRGCGKEIHETAVTCPQCGAPQQVTATSVPVNAGFSDMALNPLKNYANFSGRARRKEYWSFFLFLLLVQFVLGIISGLSGSHNSGNVLLGLLALATFIPSLAVAVRRMHDIDRSGWWLLVPIAGFIFLFFDSHPGTNRYGASPKFN